MPSPSPHAPSRWRALLVVGLLLVPVPQALGQSLLAHACEEARNAPGPSGEPTGVDAVDECSGTDDGDAELRVRADSTTLEEARSTLLAPPGAQGYPLISLAGTGERDEPVEVETTEPGVHSILVEGLPAYERLAVQFLPLETPDVGRVSPCMQPPLVSELEEEAEERAGELAIDADDGTGLGIDGTDEGDGVEAGVRLYPKDGFCAAVAATARATVDRPLFSAEEEVTPCTALACELQTTDTVAPEDSTDDEGSALFGPLMLYPGRWQIVRTGPADVARHAGDGLDEAPPCDNPLVVLCFDVEACTQTRDLLVAAPPEERCTGDPEDPASLRLPGAGSGGDGSCSVKRASDEAGVAYAWRRCGRACSRHDGGQLLANERTVDRGGDAIFEIVETWSAETESHVPHGDGCDVHRWRETDVAQLGLSVAGPRGLENRYSDTWNVSLHASVRECDRDPFPRGTGNTSRCHDAIAKEPVIVVPDYEETRDTDRCEHPAFHPPYDDEGKCVKVALDAEVVAPHERDHHSRLYHTGGEGKAMPASMTENRSSSPKKACRLAAVAAGIVGTATAATLIGIGCRTTQLADMYTSPPAERERYSEWQGTFSAASGYRCSGGCWTMHNRLASNDDWECDQMAYGAMMEMRVCGEGWAPAYVAGTFLKGLAYEGPAGELHEEGGDPANRTGGHHYWGPGLTIRSQIGVHVGQDAPPCPTRGAR